MIEEATWKLGENYYQKKASLSTQGHTRVKICKIKQFGKGKLYIRQYNTYPFFINTSHISPS